MWKHSLFPLGAPFALLPGASLLTYIDETARLLGGPPGGGGGRAPMLATRLRNGGGAIEGISNVSELAMGARTGGAKLARLGIGGGARAGSEGAWEAALSGELPTPGRGGGGGAPRTGVLGADDEDNASLNGRGGGGGAARKDVPADERAGISGACRRDGRAGGPAEAAFEAFFNDSSKKNEAKENTHKVVEEYQSHRGNYSRWHQQQRVAVDLVN